MHTQPITVVRMGSTSALRSRPQLRARIQSPLTYPGSTYSGEYIRVINGPQNRGKSKNPYVICSIFPGVGTAMTKILSSGSSPTAPYTACSYSGENVFTTKATT